MLTSAADLVYMLNWEMEKKAANDSKNSFLLNWTTLKKTIYDLSSKEENSCWIA
ncbi:hypothetical protein Q2T40_02135 [Winogradskyella maritima]|nr:hypothetical protein [Winogradskyella maritima]